jgi:hypothetical protein
MRGRSTPSTLIGAALSAARPSIGCRGKSTAAVGTPGIASGANPIRRDEAQAYSRLVAFFEPRAPEPEPTAPAPYGPPIWTGPSELLLGNWVLAQELLAKTDEAAIVLRGLCAYPNGFEFQISFLGRPPHTPQMHHALFARYRGGYGPRFGFEFSDGRRAGQSTRQGGFNVPKDENGIPTEPVMMPRGGGGGGGEFRQNFWVWPLPPDGPLVLHFDWPDRDIPDTTVQLDGTAVRRAGQSALELWPSGRTLAPGEMTGPPFTGSWQPMVATGRVIEAGSIASDDKPAQPPSKPEA